MFAKVYSAQTVLLSAHIISVEADLSRGLHSFAIVGLPDKAVEESRDRVSAAIKNSGFKSPKNKNQKVVISLAPADIKKEGPLFDLAIALSYLLASEDIKFDAEGKLFLGELSLDGKLRPIPGTLPLVVEGKKRGFREIFVPTENAREAALVEGISVYPVSTLAEVVEHLAKKSDEENRRATIEAVPRTKFVYEEPEDIVSFDDIRGQEAAKRGLTIAAAGRHNIALYGPPGTGKTMLARAFTHLLPPLAFDEALEVTAIHSVAGLLESDMATHPPFRAPHHTSSYIALVGGGTIPRPGEVTLAHRGVLFLDEFPEFDRRVIEALRQPLEDRQIAISRSKGSAIFPAQFILVAAMNPCPCGNFGSEKPCVCLPANLLRYQRKISGPIMDRIDLWIPVGRIEHEKLSAPLQKQKKGGGETGKIRKEIATAREAQKKRFAKNKKISTNSEMSVRDLAAHVPLSADVSKLLNEAATRLGLSPRSYHRVIKLARTIADLEKAKNVEVGHVLEALQYRPRNFEQI